MKLKLKVGQVIYGKPLSNQLRVSKEIKEFTVNSLGNKYFTVKDCSNFIHRNKFSYEFMTEVSEYSTNWQLYINKKDIEDEINRPILLKEIQNKLFIMSYDELLILNKSL